MLKKISCFLVFIILFYVSNVNAQVYYDKINEHGMWISNEFVNKSKDGKTKYQQMTLIVRKSDNRFLYCIEPGKSIDENKLVTGYDTDLELHANLTSLQRDRIQLLAYYGYGYKNHTDIKWYVITQFMIWQTNNLGYDIYFTDKLNGNRIDKYVEEMKELDNLVNSHYTIPKFKNSKLKAFVNLEEEFIEKNNVLAEYEISSSPNVDAYKDNNNKIKLTLKDFNEGYLLFKKEKKRFNNKCVVYIDDNNQNLFLPGDLSDVTDRINIAPLYGSVKLQKLDSNTKDNKPKHEGSLENARYGLYDNNNSLLEEKNTDKNGKINFSTKLLQGRYYIKELEASHGYQLDETKHYFDIDKNNYEVNITTYEEVISENFEIIKTLENSKTGMLEYEKGIKFGIFDLNNNLILEYTTDDYGTIKFKLDYGNYILRQLTSYKQYEKLEDFKIEVKENGKNNKFVFQDKKIKYKVKLTVYEKNTLSKIDNIEFELLAKNDKKICEKNKCQYLTNKNGEINFNNYFDYGDYLFKLIYNDEFMYIFDSDKIKLELDENTKYKDMGDYRLVELDYYLELKNKEPVIDKDENNNITNDENNKQDEIENNSFLDNNEIEKLNSETNPGNNELIVDVPNTLLNQFDILILIVISLIYPIKKYLIKKVFT